MARMQMAELEMCKDRLIRLLKSPRLRGCTGMQTLIEHGRHEVDAADRIIRDYENPTGRFSQRHDEYADREIARWREYSDAWEDILTHGDLEEN